MKSKNKIAKLNKFLQEELPLVKNLLIEATSDGYKLFDKYELRNKSTEWILAYNDMRVSVSSAPVAVAWAILHNSGEYVPAAKVLTYDDRSTRFRCERQMYEAKLRSTSDPVTIDLLQAKWSEVKFKETQASETLTKYLTLAKYKQTKGFNDETARPLAKKQLRKNR